MPPVGAEFEAEFTSEFKREHRLLDGKQFKAVFDRRQRHHGSFFSLHLFPNDQSYHRLGLAVSKKVSKKAVERNRIKRQVRESFRHLPPTAMIADTKHIGQTTMDHQYQNNYDCVIVAKPAAAGADNQALSQELDRLWRKALKYSN